MTSNDLWNNREKTTDWVTGSSRRKGVNSCMFVPSLLNPTCLIVIYYILKNVSTIYCNFCTCSVCYIICSILRRLFQCQIISDWVSDWCLSLTRSFFCNYTMPRTSFILMLWWCGLLVLDQHAEVDLYCDSSMQHQSAVGHVANWDISFWFRCIGMCA